VNWNLQGWAPGAAALKGGVTAPRFGRLGWYVRRKLLVPFLRRSQSPEYSARGVALGLLIGMTPTLGLHLLLVLAVWAIAGKFFPQRKFSLLVAMAWTCVMNPLTAAPLYYLFFVTGRLMLGGGEAVQAYGTLSQYGLPMLVGCIPWAMLMAFAGYRWSLWFVTARRSRRTLRTQTATR